jgi:Phage capsid family.
MPKVKMTESARRQLRSNNDRITEIKNRFTEIADTIVAEKRSMTQVETTEKGALEAEMQTLSLRNQAIETGEWKPTPEQIDRSQAFATVMCAMNNRSQFPENFAHLRSEGNTLIIPATEGTILRGIQDTSTIEPIVPITIGDIVQPLEKGLILSKVGCKMQYGITGTWNFPVVAGVEASIDDENAEISDSTIEISKLTPSPHRFALSIPVSNRALTQNNGMLLDIVKTQIVAGLARTLNKCMFSPTQITAKAPIGCFVKTAPTTIVKGSFTFKDVVKLKASVLATGVEFDGTAAYVCSATTYGDLESTPRDAGSGRMLIEDGKINGYPVFVTEYIGDGKLGFGVFSYELVGSFSAMSLGVDSSSAAVMKKNLTYFVLNADMDMLTLRPEAFGIAELKSVPAIGVNDTQVDLSAPSVGESVTQNVTVSGANLTTDITLTLAGANSDMFTVSPATLAKDANGAVGARITVTYLPTAVSGKTGHIATLTLSATGATSVVINLNGACS